MTPLDVIEQTRARRCLRHPVTFPEGLNVVRNGEDRRGARLRPGVSRSWSVGRGSRRLSVSRHVSVAAAHRRREAGASDGANVRTVLTPELRGPQGRHAADGAPGGHAGVDRGKRDGEADERPIVAAVYENRLRIGMALQCDPTVIYALERAGRYTATCGATTWRSTRRTTPIAMPGCRRGRLRRPGVRRSRPSSIRPTSDYLYFVSRNDGSHEFAATLEEHNRNVQKFQVRVLQGSEGRNGRKGGSGRALALPHFSFCRSTSK